MSDIDPTKVDEISDKELLVKGHEHVWLEALQCEDIYFSHPLDLDFAMLRSLKSAYMVRRDGGYGPRTKAEAVERSRSATLKSGGNSDLYDGGWDDDFA